MKKIFSLISNLLVLSVIVFTFFTSCSKSDVKTTSSTDLATSLQQSSEFSEYVTATNTIVSSINLKAINKKDVLRASSIYKSDASLTKNQFTQVLNLLHVNADVYFKQRIVMSDAIKSFQSKHSISNEQNAFLWKTVIAKNSSLFTVKNDASPIGEFITCITDAATTFAETTAICLALRKIPIIGEHLYEVCEREAVTTLIDNLTDCIGL